MIILISDMFYVGIYRTHQENMDATSGNEWSVRVDILSADMDAINMGIGDVLNVGAA